MHVLDDQYHKPARFTEPGLLERHHSYELIKILLVCVLQGRPLHGYDIAKEVERPRERCCVPREGTIYPVLKQFAEGGYVTYESKIVYGRERKTYAITNKGRDAFRIGLGE